MKPDYRNWMPRGMIVGLGTATGVLAAGSAAAVRITVAHGPDGKASCRSSPGPGRCGMSGGGGVEPVRPGDVFLRGAGGSCPGRSSRASPHPSCSPEGGVGLDVGCGSGALTIACAKRNPQGRMVGIDRWGVEYASYSRKLCERNAQGRGSGQCRLPEGRCPPSGFPGRDL